MAYRLPPLNAVRQFEAAARHLSFRAASEGLFITPSAVSHGVQTLEDWLGVPLFVRERRGLSLTPAGIAYLPYVRRSLDTLASATAAVPRNWGSRLTVSAAPSFASRVLLPNLQKFREQHPQIDLVIDTMQDLVEFPRDGVDLAIRRGRGDWPDLHCECLLLESLVPVCTPALAEFIRTPEDLVSQTLLHMTRVEEDWSVWAEAGGLTSVDLKRGVRFDTLDMVWNAAAEGIGVAIGRPPLIDRDIQTGRLVSVLGPPVESAVGYWLIAMPSSLSRPEVAAFSTWLRLEVADLCKAGAVGP